MTEFNGIPIYEDRLLWRFWFATIIIIAAVIFVIVLLYKLKFSDYKTDDSKQKRRIKKLKMESYKSAFAQRKYENALKIFQQQNPKTPILKRLSCDDKITLGVTSAFFATLIAIYLCIFFPIIIDYSTKDYQIYEGEYTQISKCKTSCVILEDGTELEGGTNADYDIPLNGKLVYTSRSKIVIGWK